MPHLKIQVEINKGKRGVPLHKLAQVTLDIQQFLVMMSQDLSLAVNPQSWIGVNFENGSLSFVAEKLESATRPEIEEFNTVFASIADKRPSPKLRRTTIAQYARIADPIEAEEAVSFGLFDVATLERLELDARTTSKAEIMTAEQVDAAKVEHLRWIELTKQTATEIKAEVQGKVRAYGSLQGKIHSLFLGSQPAYFNLRELSTGSLVKCIYKASVYPRIALALQHVNTVIHVYGFTTTDLVERKLEDMEVDQVELAEPITDEAFESIFGSDRHFTGKLTTQEFIDLARGRVQ